MDGSARMCESVLVCACRRVRWFVVVFVVVLCRRVWSLFCDVVVGVCCNGGCGWYIRGCFCVFV